MQTQLFKTYTYIFFKEIKMECFRTILYNNQEVQLLSTVKSLYNFIDLIDDDRELCIQDGLIRFLQQYQSQSQMAYNFFWHSFHQMSQFLHQYPLFTLIINSYCPFQYYRPQIFYTEHLIVDESSNLFSEKNILSNDQSIHIVSSKEQENLILEEKRKKIQRRRIQDGNYISKCQKDDRNLNSIVLRNFANFLNNHPRIHTMVEEIIKKKKFNISASAYTKLFRSCMPPRQSYMGVGKLKNFIESNKQNSEIKLVTLILLRKFISTDFFTVLLNSKKVSRPAKQKELKHGKKFWKEFLKQIS